MRDRSKTGVMRRQEPAEEEHVLRHPLGRPRWDSLFFPGPSHVHFFDPSRPEGVPWPNPDDEVLYRTALPQHYKVSGLVSGTRQIPAPTDASFYAPTIDVLWEAFGKDRLIYGSDWPVSSRFAEYPIVQRIVAEYSEAKGKEAAEKYFWRNSKDAYKWLTGKGVW